MKAKYKSVMTYVAITALVVGLAAAIIIVLNWGNWGHKDVKATKPAAPAMFDKSQSMFSFAGVAGWWQGATNRTSMALFQNSGGCFVSAEYKTGPLDATSQLQRRLSLAGISSSSLGVQDVSLQQAGAAEHYQLHQYSLSGDAGGSPIMHGLELGYMAAGNGFIETQGHCNETAQLPATLPVVNAIKFDSKK